MEAEVATTTHAAHPSPAAPFRHIVCGVDGSRAAYGAVRQAAALTGPETLVDVVAVTFEWGSGLNAGALLSAQRAETALHNAGIILSHTPAEVRLRAISGHPAWELLLGEAADADLLVLARHGIPRGEGAAIGSTATNLTHRAHLPLLLASPPSAGSAFPERILVAADGPGHPENAIRIAGRIAAHAGSKVTLLRLDWSRRARRPEIAEAIAELTEATGVEPVEIVMGGNPAREILGYAESEGASLVVTGSRGVTGLRAVRSVSERVAHHAPCSVLVVRPR